MIPRGAPYISASDLVAATVHSLAPGDPHAAQERVESLWAPNTVALLSVRSGLDALLQLYAFPAGSEIIVSAITIPHILDILTHHQLVAVPVDIDLPTLSVQAKDVRAAITGSTRAILVAHLFGSRMPLDDVAALARERGLPLIEDCAQANDGTAFRGHPDATVSMFSFGSIKRQTALGGGLLRFQDPALADRTRQLQAKYPRQPRSTYLERVAMMVMIKVLIIRPLFDAFVALCRFRGVDHDKALGTALRGFKHGSLIDRLRQQPPLGMLRLLDRRLRQSTSPAIAARMRVVATVTAEFPELNRPGDQAANHTHWLFPIQTAHPDRLMRQLWSQRIDATCGASNLTSVPAPAGRIRAAHAERFMREVLYLPLFPTATNAEVLEIARAVKALETSHPTDGG